ncbi:putative mitochondrial protein [Andalucia godoyi]|uniref:Putative mitochondrial protein n=1 Tax=Andalucia godoyi TaxID=505711 RepID=A0A8K0AJ07_ANDGO|nr:putative mitochondrial protein [Andalucia godoyi]|eukprot:ANDGO_01766.mRNA.1 putative mitochondrial protein
MGERPLTLRRVLLRTRSNAASSAAIVPTEAELRSREMGCFARRDASAVERVEQMRFARKRLDALARQTVDGLVRSHSKLFDVTTVKRLLESDSEFRSLALQFHLEHIYDYMVGQARIVGLPLSSASPSPASTTASASAPRKDPALGLAVDLERLEASAMLRSGGRRASRRTTAFSANATYRP